MSVPAACEELIQLIRKSGMVEEPKLTAYLQRRERAGGLPADAREAADEMVRDGILTYFQTEQFLLGKWRGFTIGKFKLLERVGIGGMGQVFLCEHMFMKRRVAIKVLPPAKAEQPAALGRFYREARAAGSLEHPNIVRTHDIDQDGNLHFIVMEYVDGSNLLDVVKRFGPLHLGRAVEYARQVAVGLDYAFRNGIIHRDIKPGNVLIDRHGMARILDMGLARFYKDQTDLLTVKYDDKVVLGTADYVAPEQVANSHAVDVRADIYALGASLYFLLAGHPPFPTGTVSQKLLWHRTKEPTPIRQVRPDVPEGLAAAVAKMMAKDPNRRFQTPAEVAEELARWVPAEVPLPAPEEMPQLSPAAAVLAANAEETPPPPGVGEPTPVRPRAGLGGSKTVPPGASPFAPPEKPRSVFAAQSPFRSSPRQASPFAAMGQADVPTDGVAVHELTPLDAPRRPTGQPVFAPPPAESPTRSAKAVAIVAAVAAALVALCVVGYRVLHQPTPGQATEQTTQP